MSSESSPVTTQEAKTEKTIAAITVTTGLVTGISAILINVRDLVETAKGDLSGGGSMTLETFPLVSLMIGLGLTIFGGIFLAALHVRNKKKLTSNGFVMFNLDRRQKKERWTDGWEDLIGLLILGGISVGIILTSLINEHLPSFCILGLIGSLWLHHWYKNTEKIWRNPWHWVGLILFSIVAVLTVVVPNWIVVFLVWFWSLF